MSNDLLKARLVWDGGDEVRIPPEMGVPRSDQMQGTAAERLSELAGRVCYDSLGKGRPSFSRSGEFNSAEIASKLDVIAEYRELGVQFVGVEHNGCMTCHAFGRADSNPSAFVNIKDGRYHDAANGDNLSLIEFAMKAGKFRKWSDVAAHFAQKAGVSCSRVEGYHDHILAVGHGSVLEHFNFTIGVQGFDADYAAYLLINRPGIIFHSHWHNADFRITVNLRAILEWQSFADEFGNLDDEYRIDAHNDLGRLLAELGHQVAPHIIKRPEQSSSTSAMIMPPETDHEKWISLYLSGSRGFSHEQVRHGDFTAISQRSTRYVDEDGSPWVEHPLITAYINDVHAEDTAIPSCADETMKSAQNTYRLTVHELEAYLIDRKVDKTSARKQARGAARGYLGNALQTEMIFSASVSQWRRMVQQRCSRHADAEIREVYVQVVRELQKSRYADSFQDIRLIDSPDGIGQVAEFVK
jgi:thymidylate synthase ThyX